MAATVPGDLPTVEVLDLPVAELLALFELPVVRVDEAPAVLAAVPSLHERRLVLPWPDGLACHPTILRIAGALRAAPLRLVVGVSDATTTWLSWFLADRDRDTVVWVTPGPSAGAAGDDAEAPRAVVRAMDADTGERIFRGEIGLDPAVARTPGFTVAISAVAVETHERADIVFGCDETGQWWGRGAGPDERVPLTHPAIVDAVADFVVRARR